MLSTSQRLAREVADSGAIDQDHENDFIYLVGRTPDFET